jgi:hypothetical protein
MAVATETTGAKTTISNAYISFILPQFMLSLDIGVLANLGSKTFYYRNLADDAAFVCYCPNLSQRVCLQLRLPFWHA